MKNLFLDLGTHLGQGLSHFAEMLRMDNTWEVASFEANPITYNNFCQTKVFTELSNKLNATFNNKAIYIQDGLTTINVETPPNEGETGMGSSIIPLSMWDPWNGTTKQFFKTSYEVECVDFSKIVGEHKGKNIFCKMDIEGAEFLVLDKMIKDNTLLLMQEIWIEFHDHFFTNHQEYSEKKSQIIQYLEFNKIKYHLWH